MTSEFHRAHLIGWSADDVEAVVDGLAAKGVSFERYDMPGLRTDGRGIAQMGEERGACSRTRKATS